MKLVMRGIIYLEIISKLSREEEIVYEDEGKYTIRRDEEKKNVLVYEGEKMCFTIDYQKGLVYNDEKEKRKICEKGYWYVDERCKYRCTEEEDCKTAQGKELLLKDNCIKNCPKDNYYQDYNICIRGNINDIDNQWVLKNNEKSFTNILKGLCKNGMQGGGGGRGDSRRIEKTEAENRRIETTLGCGGESRRIEENRGESRRIEENRGESRRIEEASNETQGESLLHGKRRLYGREHALELPRVKSKKLSKNVTPSKNNKNIIANIFQQYENDNDEDVSGDAINMKRIDRNRMTEEVNGNCEGENEYSTSDSLSYFTKYKDDIIQTLLSINQNNVLITGQDFTFYIYEYNSEVTSAPKVKFLGDENKALDQLLVVLTTKTSCSDDPSSNNLQFELYNKDGNKADLKPFKNNKYKFQKQLASRLKYQIINNNEVKIYDKNDPIFHNICIPFSEDGKDYTLQNRKEKLLNKNSFCDDGCEVTDLDFEQNTFNCECSLDSTAGNDDYEEDDSEIKDILDAANFKLFKCYNIPFQTNISKNIGNWIILFITIVIIATTVLYFKNDFAKIKSLLSEKSPFNPPANEEKGIFVYQSNQEKIESAMNSSFDQMIPDQNLNKMEFEQARNEDKRKFYQYYADVLSEKEINLSIVFDKSLLFKWSLKIIILSFSFSTYLFLTALFCNEDYITKRTNSKESISILYIIKYELITAAYVSIIIILIGKIVNLIKNAGDSLEEYLESKQEPDAKETPPQVYSETKFKLICLFTFIFIFMAIYWYFLTIFCGLYKHNQGPLILSTFVSIFFSILVQSFICFLITSFRFLSFCLNLNFLFLISSCLNYLL